jgi:hypothetical protein
VPTPTPTITPTLTVCPITFEDVPPGDPFFVYVRCLACRALLSGYPCGGPFEPCVPPANQPYFRPGNNATRGQVAKILSNAAGFADVIPSTVQTFEDVPPGHPFYPWVEQLAVLGLISGYPCGGPFEPCIGPLNRPYYRPYVDITRAQTAKIIAGTFFPNCQTPVKR